MEKKQDKNSSFHIKNLPGEVTARGREIWLAGLGALATVEEEGGKLFTRLVRRGEETEHRSWKQIDSAVSGLSKEATSQQQKALKGVEDTAKMVEGTVTQAVHRVLERLDVPARSEIQALSAEVEHLSARVDRLATVLEKRETPPAAAASEARTTYHVVAREDGWALLKDGAERATSVHETKKEALESGRDLAKRHAPSTLVVHKQDGEIQETLTYDAEV